MLSKDIKAINNMAEKLQKSSFISKLPFPEKYKKQIAFTLAEVLITLLIIGIVASMVIPAIIQDTQDSEFKVAYKKAYAVASNVTKQMLVNGEFMPKQTLFEYNTSTGNFNTFKSYFSVAKDCSNSNNDQCWDKNGEKIVSPYSHPDTDDLAFIDNSGMAWSLYYNWENIILVDTNGFKGPNRYGKDRWQFTFADVNNNRISIGIPSKIYTYASDITTTSGWCHYPPCYFKSWLMQ